MENQSTLPAEVAQIAQNVSAEKRNEVQSVLNHVFDGVSKMREQLETVVVSDENDRTNMKLANTIRLGVRQTRLDAEKTFDAKRAEVQAKMLGFKTEDQLWLKAKQTMQILAKEIEESARWKEETRQRFEAEQRELKVQQRIARVSRIAPEMSRSEFESMGDESFELFYSGIEKQYNDRIEAERKAEEERSETERIGRLHNERRDSLLYVWEFVPPAFKSLNMGMATDIEYRSVKEEAEKKKAAHEAERERLREEAERLKAESEAREKAIAEELARAEADRKAAEEKVRKENEAAEARIREEQRQKAELETKLKAREEAEERAKKEAEEKAAAELKARQLADKKAKAAPDKIKLEEFARQIESLEVPDLKSDEAQKILNDTNVLLTKVLVFIRQKSAAI